jgi:hypothetical protein
VTGSLEGLFDHLFEADLRREAESHLKVARVDDAEDLL